MFDLTKYKDILGKPGEGVHFHVANIAVMDVLATVVLGYIIGKLCSINPLWTILGLFVLGQFLHWLFGVDTTFMRLFK